MGALVVGVVYFYGKEEEKNATTITTLPLFQQPHAHHWKWTKYTSIATALAIILVLSVTILVYYRKKLRLVLAIFKASADFVLN